MPARRFVRGAPHASMIRRTSARDKNQCWFTHTPRNRSMRAFSTGLPGQ